MTIDPKWYDWTAGQLGKLAVSRTLVINPIIYCKISIGFDRIEDLNQVLTLKERRQLLETAAEHAAFYYETDPELTLFTALDGLAYDRTQRFES